MASGLSARRSNQPYPIWLDCGRSNQDRLTIPRRPSIVVWKQRRTWQVHKGVYWSPDYHQFNTTGSQRPTFTLSLPYQVVSIKDERQATTVVFGRSPFNLAPVQVPAQVPTPSSGHQLRGGIGETDEVVGAQPGWRFNPLFVRASIESRELQDQGKVTVTSYGVSIPYSSGHQLRD